MAKLLSKGQNMMVWNRWDDFVEKSILGKILVKTTWKITPFDFHRWYLGRGEDGRLGVLMCPITTSDFRDPLCQCETEEDRQKLVMKLKEKIFWAAQIGEILGYLRERRWKEKGSHQFCEAVANYRPKDENAIASGPQVAVVLCLGVVAFLVLRLILNA